MRTSSLVRASESLEARSLTNVCKPLKSVERIPECPPRSHSSYSAYLTRRPCRLQNSLNSLRKLNAILQINSSYQSSPMNTLRRLFCFSRKPDTTSKRSLTKSSIMSGSATSAALYAMTVSASSVTGGAPDEAKDKPHHLKNGKGFYNPWDSHGPMTAPQIGKAMIE